MMLIEFRQGKNMHRKSIQGMLLTACALLSAALSSLSAQSSKIPVLDECKAATRGLTLYQRNCPAKAKVYSAVDLYCNQKGQRKRVGQNLTLCDSNYNGSEQKVVTIVVAPATAAEKAAACPMESELTLILHGVEPNPR
jgi:hypothetical protein